MILTGLTHNSKQHHRWLWSSFFPATLLAVLWLHHMLRLTKFRRDIMWLPFSFVYPFPEWLFVQLIYVTLSIVFQISVEPHSASMWIVCSMSHLNKLGNSGDICSLTKLTRIYCFFFDESMSLPSAVVDVKLTISLR